MKTIINKVLVLAFVAQMVVSSTGIVSAQSYNDFGGTSFVDTSYGDGFNFVNYDPSTSVTYDNFSNTSFNNPSTFFGDTSCLGCTGNTSGYNFVNYDPSIPVGYNDFNNTSFNNPSTYYGNTSCVGCGSYSSPVVSDVSNYSPVTYGNTYGNVDYGYSNYGNIDYGYSNYGNINYGYTTGSSFTGVVVSNNNINTQCPSGSSYINGTCQINNITCPAGSTLINGHCQINTTTCPAGTALVNGTCVTNTTNCPSGSTFVNGTCQINTTTCPSGTTLINGVCQAPISCPSGTTYQNGTCVGQNTTTCPNGSTFINGVCQINTTSCPAGSYLQNGKCIVQSTSYTCPNGQVVSALYSCPVTYGSTSYGNTSYAYTSMPIIYQTCWDGSTIPNTSVCPSQYKVCANGTSIPVYQTCFVAQLPVYVPPPVIKFNNVVTSPATQITNTSARCNGIGLIAQGAQSSGWFEYGQTTNLGRSTAQAMIGTSLTAPFSNMLTNLQSSTTYYCRAVMQNQYGLVKGEIVKFTTKGKAATYVQPAPKKTVTKTVKKTEKKSQIICIDGSIVSVGDQTSASMLNQGQKLIAIQLEKVTGDMTVGGNASYRLSYKNLSDSALSGIEIKIVVPQELSVTDVPTGGYDEATHTMTFSGLSLNPYSENVIQWAGIVADDSQIGKTVVTTAYVLYTVPGTNVQDEVTAYTASSIMSPTGAVSNSTGNKNVIGTGPSFLPENLIEWLALIAILFILFILGRSIASSYKKGTEAHH